MNVEAAVDQVAIVQQSPAVVKPGTQGPLPGSSVRLQTQHEYACHGRVIDTPPAGRISVRLDDGSELQTEAQNLEVVLPRKVLLAAGSEGVEVWDWDRGIRIWTLMEQELVISAVAVSPQNGRVAAGTKEPECGIKVYDIRTGRATMSLHGHSGWGRCTCMWNFSKCPVQGHRGLVSGLAFSSCGGKLVSVSHDTHVKIWDTWTGSLINRGHRMNHEGRITSLAFCPDGHASCTFATGGENNVRIWDLDTLELKTSLAVNIDIGDITFSPCGRFLAVGGKGNLAGQLANVRILDVKSSRQLPAICRSSCSVSAVAFSPTGNRLVTVATTGQIVEWDLKTGSCRREGAVKLRFDNVLREEEKCTGLCYSNNGQWITVSFGDRIFSSSTLGTHLEFQRAGPHNVGEEGRITVTLLDVLPLTSHTDMLLAVMMGTHDRVGANCPFRALSLDELLKILFIKPSFH